MRALVLGFSLLATLALAQPPRMAALSDLQVQQVGLECPKPELLGTSFSGLTNPERDVQTEAGRDALMQNMAGPMAEAIAAIEQQLKELPAGDPSRPQLEDALKQLKAQQAAQENLSRVVSEQNSRFASSRGCASASAWREATLPAFQAADKALRDLYAIAWQSSATLVTRFSEPTYRATATLRLRGLYYGAAQKVYENGRMYLLGLELARGNEDCGSARASLIGSLATPQLPAA